MRKEEEAAAAAAECYHWKDFEWEDLRREIEADPLLRYHLLAPATATAAAQSAPPSDDSQPWDHFHTRHSSGKFFKERRYILKEFPELLSCDKDAKILEVGCGNGSTILPILRGNGNVNVYACDCSVEALKRAEDIIYAAGLIAAKTRFHPFLCDFSISGFPKWLACDNCRDLFSMKQDNFLSDVVDLAERSSMDGHNCCIGGVDFVTLIFTLSAVPRHRMSAAIAACFSVLKPGGMLLFRDYGLYDMTMLRFEPEKKVGFREYIRSDGTHSYFFSLDIVKDLFLRAGFTEVELEYCCVKLVNRRTGKIMRRVWIHGKFRKPSWSVPTCAPAHPTLLEYFKAPYY